MILTEDADGVGLDLGVGDLLVDGVTLDVDVPVPGADLERDVGHGPPAAFLRLKPPGMVSLRIEIDNKLSLIKMMGPSLCQETRAREGEAFNYLQISRIKRELNLSWAHERFLQLLVE